MLRKCKKAVQFLIGQFGLFCEKFDKNTNEDLRKILDLAIVADAKNKKIRSAPSVKVYREYFDTFKTAVEKFNELYPDVVPETISPQEFIHNFPSYCDKVRKIKKRNRHVAEASS